jgi:hypothetical protein
MTKTSNKLCLIKSACSLFHFTHKRHLVEPFDQVFFCDLDVELGGICSITLERIFIKSDSEWLARFPRLRCKFCAVSTCLDASSRIRSKGLFEKSSAIILILLFPKLTIRRDMACLENVVNRPDIMLGVERIGADLEIPLATFGHLA